ncbi:MAG TPA: nuclear transport factor 2 family protein [Dermatophilaceae bacterium]|nr:nuclear transport factor 2 family protein [Dermatophilaceae bacterium]
MLEHEYEGPDGVIKYLTSLFAMTDGTFKSESEALFADDDRVVSLDHVTGTRMGNVLDTHVVHVFLVRDGKVIEVTDFASEPKANEAFWD